MPHASSTIEVRPLGAKLSKSSQVGAEIILPPSSPLLSLSSFSSDDAAKLRRAVHEHSVVVVRGQSGIAPDVLVQIGQLFDPKAEAVHSGGAKQVDDERNILARNMGQRVPEVPQVQIIGQGNHDGYYGIPELNLKHVDHTEFHQNPHTPEELAVGFTRPYRWHMDAPLYEKMPGKVTTLHCLEIPELPDQKIRFPEGSVMPVAAGATAFFSGHRAFQLLSPEEQEFAINTTVHYAPRAYEWIRDCKATPDGLTIASVGLEKELGQLSNFSWDQVQSFPMVWSNEGTGLPHLQILACCVYALTTIDPVTGEKTTCTDVAEVRRICHNLLSKVYTPENIYAHRWQKGDLVIFHNRGVLHSITGQLATSGEKRLLWQCSLAGSDKPEAYSTGK